MDKSKRTLSLSCIGIGLALLLSPLAAESISGEYVWYADATFKRASYVGFLYYNENTLSMRYYAPLDTGKGLTEKSIDLYVTHDGGTLTGERVIGATDDDNIAIVNYLHDLFYDLCSVSAGAQDLNVFGGKSVVEKDDMVPVFSIKRIKGADNKVLLQIVTVGRLSSSDDKSFTAFRGLPISQGGKSKGKKIKARKTAKGSDTVECSAGAMRFALDSAWHRSMDNMWMLGDDAVVTVAELSGVKSEEDMALYAKLLVTSRGDAYIDWRTLKAEKGEGLYRIECVTLGTPAMRTFRIMQGGILFSLTANDAAYQANKAYFNAITASFQSKTR